MRIQAVPGKPAKLPNIEFKAAGHGFRHTNFICSCGIDCKCKRTQRFFVVKLAIDSEVRTQIEDTTSAPSFRRESEAILSLLRSNGVKIEEDITFGNKKFLYGQKKLKLSIKGKEYTAIGNGETRSEVFTTSFINILRQYLIHEAIYSP